MLIADPRFRETVDRMRADLPTVEKIIWTGDETGTLPEGDRDLRYEEIISGMPPAKLPDVDVAEQDIAQIYYTSGTTGRPKGVMLTHKNVTVHALGTIAELHLTDRDVWLHAAPLFHLADAWATWAVTWVGGTHVLVGEFDPPAVLAAIEKEKVTLTNLIPTMLNMLVNYPGVSDFDYRRLRVLLSGGAPIAPEVVRRIVETFGCDYIQTYGMTETSPYLTLSILKGHLLQRSPEEQLRFKSKTGREFIAVELKVVTDDGREIKKDEKEVGEIIVRGDTVTPGYWQLPGGNGAGDQERLALHGRHGRHGRRGVRDDRRPHERHDRHRRGECLLHRGGKRSLPAPGRPGVRRCRGARREMG